MLTTVIIILFVVCLLLNIVGIVGAIVPGLPGPPISFVGMICCLVAYYNVPMLVATILMLVLVVVVTVLDFLAPGILAKQGGGGKWATWGANIGLIVGMFFSPWGLLLGPFIGALIGAIADLELWRDYSKIMAGFKVALFATLSLVVSTVFKLLVCIVIFVLCGIDFLVWIFY